MRCLSSWVPELNRLAGVQERQYPLSGPATVIATIFDTNLLPKQMDTAGNSRYHS